MDNNQEIYLDYAALTPIDPRVRKAMEPYFGDKYGNPSSLYRRGRAAKAAVEDARNKIASILNCQPYEIIFTGSGTESDNMAILGIARAKSKEQKLHIITTQIEHHAILNACKQLEKEGFEVTYLPVDQDGIVKIDELKKAIRPKTILVSVMYANNEIGTVQPLAQIGEMLKSVQDGRKQKIYFHTDACQAAGYLDLNVQKLGVDLLTLNGSKIYGPTGTAILYKKKGVGLEPLVYGGGQENGLRPATENLAGIVGLSMALKIVQSVREQEYGRLSDLRDYLAKNLLEKIPLSRVNGSLDKRLPGNLNMSFLNVEGEAMLLMLDEAGIAVSTGSACTSGSLDPSHVLLALGLTHEAAHGSLRFSLGRQTDRYELVRVIEALPKIIEYLRSLSPLNLGQEAFFEKK